jgi:hypothetical protein
MDHYSRHTRFVIEIRELASDNQNQYKKYIENLLRRRRERVSFKLLLVMLCTPAFVRIREIGKVELVNVTSKVTFAMLLFLYTCRLASNDSFEAVVCTRSYGYEYVPAVSLCLTVVNLILAPLACSTLI